MSIPIPPAIPAAHPGFPQKGEVWYVHIPNQPGDPHQPRPAVVVSRDVRNKHSTDVMVVPVFTESTTYNDTYVTIPQNEGGMPHKSVAKCDQATTIDKSFLQDGPLGKRVSQALMWQIHYAIRRALGETRVP